MFAASLITLAMIVFFNSFYMSKIIIILGIFVVAPGRCVWRRLDRHSLEQRSGRGCEQDAAGLRFKTNDYK